MIDKIKELISKHREIIIYLIVGVMTTIVSWASCFVGERYVFDVNHDILNAVNNTMSWIVGVCFSYPLNRRWVFQSKNPKILKEFTGFAGSRVSTWILDVVIMWVTVNLLHMNYWIAKIFISAVLVTILNYVFSKLFIFKKKPESEQ